MTLNDYRIYKTSIYTKYQSSSSTPRSALFIFKALGFAKPDDLSLTAITHVDVSWQALSGLRQEFSGLWMCLNGLTCFNPFWRRCTGIHVWRTIDLFKVFFSCQMFQEGWIRKGPKPAIAQNCHSACFRELGEADGCWQLIPDIPRPTIKIIKEVVHVQKWLEISVLCSVPVTALNLKLQRLFRSLAVWPLNVPWQQSIDTEKHRASMDPDPWNLEAMKCHLVAFLGPRGLTRMALRFQEPSSANCAMDLTSACNACNVHQDVQAMKDRKNTGKTKRRSCWPNKNPPEINGNSGEINENHVKSASYIILLMAKACQKNIYLFGPTRIAMGV